MFDMSLNTPFGGNKIFSLFLMLSFLLSPNEPTQISLHLLKGPGFKKVWTCVTFL